MNFTMIPLAMALLGSQPQVDQTNEKIQKDVQGCVAIVNSETNKVVKVQCDENSNLDLNQDESGEIIAKFLRQNNIETIDSVHTSWTEGK